MVEHTVCGKNHKLSLAINARSKLNKQGAVIRLSLCIKSSTVTAYFTAFFALMNNNKSSFRVGLGADRSQKAAALVGAITGIYINMYRPKAKGTMISRACSHRENLFATMQANKCLVFFRKAFLFHSNYL